MKTVTNETAKRFADEYLQPDTWRTPRDVE